MLSPAPGELPALARASQPSSARLIRMQAAVIDGIGAPSATQSHALSDQREQSSVSSMSIAELPDELLDQIFEHLPEGVHFLVRASHVCRRWRHLARHHSNFCSNIYITDIDARGSLIRQERVRAHAERLAAQLASSEQPLRVTICLCEWVTNMIDATLPLLHWHLHRIASFSFVSYRGHSFQKVLAMLDAPAPLLEYLRVDAVDYARANHPDELILSRTFLSGKDRLRTLSLCPFAFPDGLVGSASLEELGLRMRGASANVESALAAYPRIRRLDLSFQLHAHAQGPVDALRLVESAQVVRLHTVSIQQGHGSLPFYEAVLATHLHGPLRITELFVVERRGTSFDITLCEATSGRQRLLLGTILDLYGYTDEPDLDAFRALGIADRLVELRACANAIDSVSLMFPALPMLSVFTVVLGHRRTGTVVHPDPDIWHSFHATDMWEEHFDCPALTKLVIEGNGESCSTSWLAHLAGHVLDAKRRRKLELELRGTRLLGNPQEIWGYFESISMCPV